MELTAPLLDEVITSTVRNDAKNFVTRERINSTIFISNQADRHVLSPNSLNPASGWYAVTGLSGGDSI